MYFLYFKHLSIWKVQSRFKGWKFPLMVNFLLLQRVTLSWKYLWWFLGFCSFWYKYSLIHNTHIKRKKNPNIIILNYNKYIHENITKYREQKQVNGLHLEIKIDWKCVVWKHNATAAIMYPLKYIFFLN